MGSRHTDGADTEGEVAGPGEESDVPVWEDEYFERVSGRLLHSYDLERDRTVRGERFPLYGRMEVRNRKHFFHPALSFGEHRATEHLFATRTDSVTVADLDRYVDIGHDLADEWIDADEEHFSTDFTFAVVAPAFGEDVRSFVSGFRDRTLLRYGYNGHYEVNLVVAAPESEAVVSSETTDLDRAFATWTDGDEEESGGLLARLL